MAKKIEVTCDVDEENSEFVCQIKKDGVTDKKIKGKDWDAIGPYLKSRM